MAEEGNCTSDLKKCRWQPEDVKERVAEHRASTRQNSSPTCPSHSDPPPIHMTFPSSSDMDVSTSSGLLSSGLATSPPSTIGPGDSVSQVGSITGSPSTGEIPSPGEPPAKRSRKSSTRSAATQSTPQQWNDTLQNKFETQIAQITASQGLPLSWVENPKWENFLWEFLPGAHNLSQGRLTWIIIPRTLAVMQGVARGPLQGSMGTLQADGWSGINSVHVIGCMLTARGSINLHCPSS
ncbi:hypothetical protein PM082_004949 [Marasmius tenuissimus]|nr:hypothetical protein PM082_004949 [Marasmius tenuissimus]